MILQIDDWVFDVDMERTMEYSANEAAENCKCAFCRNFYAAIDETNPELRPFLAQFGLNVEAPEYMSPIPFNRECIAYNPDYIVFGKILKQGTFEMSAGVSNLVASPCEDQAYFELFTYEVSTPWALDEPMPEEWGVPSDQKPDTPDEFSKKIMQ